MKKKSWIKIKTSFSAQHAWFDCPYKEVEFLKQLHRHIFNVLVKITVSHDDREKEFFMVKKYVEDIIQNKILDGSSLNVNRIIGELSCEQMCDIIHENLIKKYKNDDIIIEVDEDGENGAVVEYIRS